MNSSLQVYDEDASPAGDLITEHQTISEMLDTAGIRFEHWQSSVCLAPDAAQEDILKVYADDIASLNEEYGFKTVDVIHITPDHPEKSILRDKFLHEHTHDDFELRFFVSGQGLFYIRTQGKVYAVLCTGGDLISVPANTRHWFDTGADPNLRAIRFFRIEEGWVANFTGDDIADRFPGLEPS